MSGIGRIIILVILAIIVIKALGIDVNLWFNNGLTFLKEIMD